MKLLKRVLAVLCAIMMVVDLCLASCLTVYAREYYRAEDMIAEDSQPEMAALNVEETVPASEEIATQPAETPAADTEQTEVTTVAETTAVAGETESQAQTTVETQSGKTIESTESSSETEVKDEEAVITRYDYQSPEVNVLVTLSDPADLPDEAELVVTPVTLSRSTEKKIEEEALKENKSIENIVAYDIKFVVDGVEVQPGATVRVSVSLPEIEAGQSAAVYHVDDNNTVENMDGNVDAEGNVVFDTPHFSTYVIVQQGGEAVKVTVEHYDSATNQQIYSTDELTLPVGGLVNGYTKATNWDVQKVDVDGTEYTSENDYKKIKVSKDATIKVYYTAKKKTVSGATTFYDYTVKAGTSGKGWNKTYYSINMDAAYEGTLGLDTSHRLMAGVRDHGYGQNYDVYRNDSRYNFTVNGLEANNHNTGVGAGDGVVKGLLHGLNENGEVVFNYADPGFFENDDFSVTVGTGYYAEKKDLRKVYTDYQLNFSQLGDTYTLNSVIKNGVVQDNAGEGFFPLDSVKRETEDEADENGHNCFFGMRYDVTFTIGDYVGPLDYEFTGDDDLWVVLDGNKVVIDLGGIHGARTGSVNLWESLGFTSETITEAQKNEEHTLTILYMERGAGDSNCNMKFTLPSARISDVSNVPMTNLLLKKVNSKSEVLEGAKFRLVEDATGYTTTASSLADGTITFTKLREGTYTLTETHAPEGYIPSVSTWKVRVTLDAEGKAVANLYLVDGETEAKVDPDEGGIYKILNMTEEERIDSAMEYSKTAKVKDWDERTYDINITAASKVTSSTTTETGGVADIMMVFDTSGSMLYNGREATDSGGFREVGKFKNVKETLDTTKVYYYTNELVNEKYSRWNYYNAKQPMIYRDGKWIYYNGYSWTEAPNNSEEKIYTLDSGLTGLKEAAITFVTSTGVGSPDSRLGVATFNSVNALNRGLTSADSAGVDQLVRTIAELKASGGTFPSGGLQQAYNELNDNKRADTPQYVILFTDGAADDDDKSSAETQASQLKQAGVIVYTIGLKLDKDAEEWLRTNIASEGCAFEVDDIGSLQEIFKTIQQTVSQSLSIKNAEITDVIDERFVIVDTNNKPVEDGTVIDGGTVHVDKNGNYSIKWTEQTIPNKAEGTWNKTITVKAKDAFIGGNAVPTNVSPNSKISTGYGDAVLPQPTVNVKIDLPVNNQVVTIYKGDKVPSVYKDGSTEKSIIDTLFSYKKDIAEKFAFGINENDFTFEWYTDPELANKVDPLTEQKPDATTNYYLKLSYNKAGNPSAESNENTTKDGVTYIANGNAINTGKNLLKADDTIFTGEAGKGYGVYKVNVIPGKIEITKELKEALPQGQSKTFTFNVYKLTGEGANAQEELAETVTIEVTSAHGTNPVTLAADQAAKLASLSRATYVIREAEVNGYAVESVSVDDTITDCQAVSDYTSEGKGTPEAVFILGNDKEGNDVIADDYYITQDITKDNFKQKVMKENGYGLIGKVGVTNVEVIKNWAVIKRSTSAPDMYLNDAEFLAVNESGVKYIGVSGQNKTINGENVDLGIMSWYATDANGAKTGDAITLPKGTYTFTETKAPTGYACSTVTWTIDIARDGSLISIKAGDSVLEGTADISGTVCYYYDNEPLYELPEAGGLGIYWYTIGGMLFMMAAALILYKNKHGEVLKR